MDYALVGRHDRSSSNGTFFFLFFSLSLSLSTHAFLCASAPVSRPVLWKAHDRRPLSVPIEIRTGKPQKQGQKRRGTCFIFRCTPDSFFFFRALTRPQNLKTKTKNASLSPAPRTVRSSRSSEIRSRCTTREPSRTGPSSTRRSTGERERERKKFPPPFFSL